MPTSATMCVITRNTSKSSWSRSPVTVKSPRPVVHRNVSKFGAMGRWTCSPKWPHGYQSQTTVASRGYSNLWQFVQWCARMVCCFIW